MAVIVDTAVWSLALRRQKQHLNPDQESVVTEWERLVRDGEATLIGPIRQEILSGIRDESSFNNLRKRLLHFDDLPLATKDYEQAAQFFNRLRLKGITGTPIDLTICAAAHRYSVAIFTTDQDFNLYSQHLQIRLFNARL